MQDIVVLMFMFLTRIGLPLGTIIGAGYLINRWYSRQEMTGIAEVAEEEPQVAASASDAVAAKPKLREVKRRAA